MRSHMVDGIHVDLPEWAGCCDELAEWLVRNGLQGVVTHGVWTGPVSRLWGWRRDRWKRDVLGRPLHCWIARSPDDVLDPLRWVFEGVFPYVYQGPGDFYSKPRDGGA